MGTTSGGGGGKSGDGKSPQYIGTTDGPQTWICGQHGEFTMAIEDDGYIKDAVMIAAKPAPVRMSRRNIFRLLIRIIKINISYSLAR